MSEPETTNEAACGGSGLTAELERMVKLAKRSHYSCEDCWYSCPKAEDGTCNDAKGDECDCGADEHNAEVDALASTLRNMMRSNARLTAPDTAHRSNDE